MRETLFRGLMSGLAWTLFPLLVFSQSFGRYPTWWMLICGCLTGVLVTLLLRATGRGLSPRSRLLLCIPTVFLGEALWALLLTLPIGSEGKWPERWYELTLGIYYTNVLGLFILLFAPLAYLNAWWVLGSDGADNG